VEAIVAPQGSLQQETNRKVVGFVAKTTPYDNGEFAVATQPKPTVADADLSKSEEQVSESSPNPKTMKNHNLRPKAVGLLAAIAAIAMSGGRTLPLDEPSSSLLPVAAAAVQFTPAMDGQGYRSFLLRASQLENP
jgi:translation elongation factor EF-1beta